MEDTSLDTVTESGYALQVLLISSDDDLVTELVSRLGADSVVVADNLESAWRKLDSLDCAVAIVDMDTDPAPDRSRLLELKNAWPALIIVALCKNEAMSELVNSAASAAIFRVMAKPPATGQFKLALQAAFSEHEQLRRRLANGEDLTISVGTDNSRISTLLQDHQHLALAGMVAALLVTMFIFYLVARDAPETEKDIASDAEADTQNISAVSRPAQIGEIDDLLAFAQSAMTNGQLIKPENSSAAFYYNQVLRLDPFDGDALAGLNAVTDQLVNRAYSFLADDNTTAASSDLDAVAAIRSTHPRLDEARVAVDERIAELAPPTSGDDPATLASEEELAAMRAAAAAVEREQALLGEIDAAIRSGNLVSLREGSAVRLVNDAWSQVDTPSQPLIDRAERVAALIIDAGTSALANSDILRAEIMVAQLASLPQTSIPGRSAFEATVAEVVRIANAVIEPARRTRMVQPTYPRNASRRGIEGWVHLSFNITPNGDVADIEVVESTPEETFEEAAITAVSGWKYLPRTVDGVPAREAMEVRLQFRL